MSLICTTRSTEKEIKEIIEIEIMAITLKEGELSSSDAAMSWVDMSGFHCRTEQFLLFESEKLFKT
jgi:hypothetical protein